MFISHFACEITYSEYKLFRMVRCDAESQQQTAETPTISVDLRWVKQFGTTNRSTREVQADNLSAVDMIAPVNPVALVSISSLARWPRIRLTVVVNQI